MAPRTKARDSHPIQVVARRTGLTQDTLRAWEKRYLAVRPHRTSTGRRVYSSADIDRLQWLRRATLGGRSIGQVAGLPTEELRALVRDDDAKSAAGGVRAGTPRREPIGQPADADELLARCMTAVEKLDPAGLDEALARAHVTLSSPLLLDRLVAPLIRRVGDCWRDGTFRVAHEHLLTAVLRTFLARLSESHSLPAAAPSLLVTTPSAQLHELGALVVASVAAEEGWRVLYLGPDMPAQEIAAAAIQSGARAVALSVVYPADDPRLAEEILATRRHLPDGTLLFVGGRAAEAMRRDLVGGGAEIVTQIPDFRVRLEQVGGGSGGRGAS